MPLKDINIFSMPVKCDPLAQGGLSVAYFGAPDDELHLERCSLIPNKSTVHPPDEITRWVCQALPRPCQLNKKVETVFKVQIFPVHRMLLTEVQLPRNATGRRANVIR